MMCIFVMGCDGYIGNAITQSLLNKGHDVIGFDNFWRRQWIKNEMGSMSATPIYKMREKVDMFKDFYDLDFPFEFEEIDCARQSSYLELLFEDYKPDIVINLAHNPSAPYSMKSRENAEKVLYNNINTTNNLLWLIKKHVPDCHYITIGTAGEYDHYCNVDIEEGYFEFIHKGRQSNQMIFPRRPGSIYHTSKVASTYLIDYLTRVWDLRCTDVMQGIVFGMFTDEISHSNVYSRFDSDEAGGTVINRFIVQAVLGVPLTIYGDGEHQRSFLSLNDSVQALMIAVDNPPQPGKVQTWNQLSEWHSIKDIAEQVINAGREEFGISVRSQFIPTPRKEYTGEHYYNFITRNLTSKGYKPTRSINQEIAYALENLLPLKEKLEPLKKVVMPKINFTKDG